MSITSAWFRSGTVSVASNSKTVQGTATAWINHLTPIGVGDAFTTDFSTFYEVVEILSDTQIKLDRPYKGTSINNSPYAIVRNGSSNFSVRTAAAVQKSLNWYQEQLGLTNQLLTEDGDIVVELPDATTITLWSEKKKQRLFEEKIAAGQKALDDFDKATTEALTAEFNQRFAMSEAEFEARREQNRHEYAGSGFVEPGKDYHTPINQGLWAFPSEQNVLYLGQDSGHGNGDSRTDYSVVNVDGVIFDLRRVQNTRDRARIMLPNPPDGTQTYDRATGEYRDYKTYSDSRYPDELVAATHNEAVCRAFEGLVAAPKTTFDGSKQNNLSGNIQTTILNISRDTIKWDSPTTAAAGVLFYADFIEGTQYRVSGLVGAEKAVSTVNYLISTNGFSEDRIGLLDGGTTDNWSNKFEFVITCKTSGRYPIEFFFNASDNPRWISNLSCRPVTEQVITSRQDLVFLETWLEKVSDKDIVVPLGNVQYGATTWNGIALNKLTDLGIGQGYSAFGEWDSNTVGYGARWSALSDADKQKFLAEPANNLYYSAAHGLCQWRYRVRSVAGYGNDWHVYAQWQKGQSYEKFMGFGGNTPKSKVRPRGSHDITFDSDFCSYSDRLGAIYAANNTDSPTPDMRFRQEGANISFAHEYSALSIALVQRLNSGAYHPMNPNGCGLWRGIKDDGQTTSTTITNWHDPRTKMKAISLVDCFKTYSHDVRPDRIPAASNYGGNIGNGGHTGRPSSDPYQLYDAVSAGQVKNLRLSARKMNTNELRENAVHDAVSGEMRGWEAITVTTISPTSFVDEDEVNIAVYVLGNNNPVSKSDRLIPKPGDVLYAKQNNASSYAPVTVKSASWQSNDGGRWHITFTTNQVRGSSYRLLCCYSGSPQFDTLPHCDIIGSPENVAATMATLGVDRLVGQWIPVIPDGANKVYSFNKKLHGVSTLGRVHTEDNGLTWRNADTAGFDSIQNHLMSAAQTGTTQFLTYPALSNQTAPATNSVVVGSVGNVYFSVAPENHWGNRLHGSLSGNIGKSYGNNYVRYYTCNGWIMDNVSVLSPSTGFEPSHVALQVFTPDNNSPALKTLTTLTEKDGLLYLQCHGSELKYDTTANNWGDNQKIPIVSGDSTQTDLNGHKVKTFCHHSIMPLGIAHNTNK